MNKPSTQDVLNYAIMVITLVIALYSLRVSNQVSNTVQPESAHHHHHEQVPDSAFPPELNPHDRSKVHYHFSKDGTLHIHNGVSKMLE